MIIFALQKIPEVSRRISVFKLLINEKSPYDEFEKLIRKEIIPEDELIQVVSANIIL